MQAASAVTGERKRAEFKRPGYTLVLEFPPDHSFCSASYRPTSGATPLSRGDLQMFLAQLSVKEGIDEDALQRLLAASLRNEGADAVVIARGVPMVPGTPGRIVLAGERDSPAADDEGREDGTEVVDFRHVQDFINVRAGDLIGTVVPPGAGTPGRSVRGETIPAVDGAPFRVKPGKNVRYDEGERALYALSDGRVLISGEEISVEEVYLVPGDLDFKFGNIDFNGFVEIRGDILDGFSVRAKGLKVHGTIGASRIETSGDMAICGMNGQGRGYVRCGGNLSATYIYETTVEAAADVLVESDVRLCSIHTLGMLKVAKGGVVGGEVVALAGVEAASLGNVNSLHTTLTAGVSYLDLEELSRKFGELKELIERFNRDQRGGQADPVAFQAARQAITAEIRAIRERRYERMNPKVNARRKIYPGVVITLGSLSEEIRDELNGPLSVVENSLEGGFRFLGMTDLSVTAEQIEASFARVR